MAEPTTPEESAPSDGADVDDAPVTELYGCPVSDSRGQAVVHPTRDGYLAAVKALTDDGYSTCVDLTAIDFVAHPGRTLPEGIEPERFEVAAVFVDIAAHRRLRVRVQVPESEPTLATMFDVHPGTEAMEREVFDMFGITFDDHPDMTRILMPEDWEGHPLRKDYEIGAIPVQFKASPA